MPALSASAAVWLGRLGTLIERIAELFGSALGHRLLRNLHHRRLHSFLDHFAHKVLVGPVRRLRIDPLPLHVWI